MNEKLYESLVRDYGDECVKITQNLIDRSYKQGKADKRAEIIRIIEECVWRDADMLVELIRGAE